MTTPASHPFTTIAAVQSLAPDIISFPPTDLIDDALIFSAGTKMGAPQGDSPLVRCPYVLSVTDGATPEGTVIAESEIDSREALIRSSKLRNSPLLDSCELPVSGRAEAYIQACKPSVEDEFEPEDWRAMKRFEKEKQKPPPNRCGR